VDSLSRQTGPSKASGGAAAVIPAGCREAPCTTDSKSLERPRHASAGNRRRVAVWTKICAACPSKTRTETAPRRFYSTPFHATLTYTRTNTISDTVALVSSECTEKDKIIISL